jgi:hypothetical protein
LKQSRSEKGVRSKNENSRPQRDPAQIPVANQPFDDPAMLFKPNGATVRKDLGPASIERRM